MVKLSDYTKVIHITNGWSGDKKYCVTDKTGQRYLLRISPTEQYDRKKSEFEHMQQVASLVIPMCKPVEFGSCDEGIYSLQTWIDGKDAEEVIPILSDRKRYSYGFEAGQILRKIHSIPAPDSIENWESFFNQKIDRKIIMYNECSLKYDNGAAFIEYIEANRHLLKNRPQVYQHGDYHIGNLMIDNNGQIVVIDFNRNDYGDPWEEFNRIVWCAQSAPLFATGMVDGYFDGRVPMDFWNLLALYIASNTLSSLPWAIPFGQGEIDTMTNQAKEVLEWYDGMKNPVPTWYVKNYIYKLF
ncbi:phosphotransferase family protein [uncultured Methanolobus sp.]|uniref:aminoglycoside phosphotransferase family protein n=1 Tax=uncultured Methanolobus sp. TaxID=218300 RepID=UPI0029C6E65C|nr:phosphotransferase family protein [uncultured Methanolobus sp.]